MPAPGDLIDPGGPGFFFFEDAPAEEGVEPRFRRGQLDSHVVDFLNSAEGLQLNRALWGSATRRSGAGSSTWSSPSPTRPATDAPTVSGGAGIRVASRDDGSPLLDVAAGLWLTGHAFRGMDRDRLSRGGGIVAIELSLHERVRVEGHPDKVCDRISDEIVDLVYREAKKTGVDPWTVRIACETLATNNRVVIAGEVRLPDSLMKTDKTGRKVINPAKSKSVARKAIRAIGYEQDGFHWKTAKIDVLLHSQSPTSLRASKRLRQAGRGRGRRPGHLFGYACNETPTDAGAALLFAQDPGASRAAGTRVKATPAGSARTQEPGHRPLRERQGERGHADRALDQHLDESWDSKKVRKVVGALHHRGPLGDLRIADDCNWYINPTGKFVIGGTGRRCGAS